jgi:hypothetical protein
MEIYFIEINGNRFRNFKKYEEAYELVIRMILDSPNSKIKIILEEFCDFGHSDSGCKTYVLFEFNNSIIIKK